jgi:hypothetical protein
MSDAFDVFGALLQLAKNRTSDAKRNKLEKMIFMY